MKKTFLRTILRLGLTVVLAASVAPAPSSAQETRDSQNKQLQEDSVEIAGAGKKEERILGVWDSRVTVRNCATGAPITTFRAMETFLSGGGLVDTNAAPPSTRGPGFGRWQYVSASQYTATFRFFLYNADGSFAGVRRVTRTIDLDGDNLTSTVGVEVFDTTDVLISTACATEVAKRVE